MEDLAPSYQFVLRFIEDTRGGVPLRTTLQSYLRTHRGPFAGALSSWYTHWERGDLAAFNASLQDSSCSSFQKALFDLLSLNVSGCSILSALENLEEEMRIASRFQLETHLSRLPFKLLLPLLFLQFPALLILMLGPMVHQLLVEVQ